MFHIFACFVASKKDQIAEYSQNRSMGPSKVQSSIFNDLHSTIMSTFCYILPCFLSFSCPKPGHPISHAKWPNRFGFTFRFRIPKSSPGSSASKPPTSPTASGAPPGGRGTWRWWWTGGCSSAEGPVGRNTMGHLGG